MRTRARQEPVERTLRTIEQQVLEEVWIGRKARVAATVATAALGTAAIGRWWNSGASTLPMLHGDTVVQVTTVVFLTACAMSLLALRMKHFRWCCAAAYTSALSTVLGVGALWWHQTARSSDRLHWILLAAAAAALLTATWIVVILTPLDRSQPDMRTRRTAGNQRGHH